MNIITVIPARGGSKGIPKKNIIDFCGKPLIYWTIQQSLDSKLINKTYVSTDNKEIKLISKQFGAEVIDRPDKLAIDTSPSEDALLHTLNIVNDSSIDLVVFLQATSPMRKSKDIDNAINCLITNNYDSVFS